MPDVRQVFSAARPPRRLAAAVLAFGWLAVMALGMATAARAQPGSLPEPVIDPNMGSAASLAQQQNPQNSAQSQMPQRQMAVRAAQPPAGASAGQPAAPLITQPPPPQILQPAMQQQIRLTQAPSLPPPSPLEQSLQETLQTLAMAGARQVAPSQARVEVELGRLDPRLRLAPCAQIQPYLPPNQRMWGRSRIGIRCLSGPTKWNVSLPLTIRVFAPAYIAVSDLPTGTELTQEHLRLAETDIAGDAGFIYTQPEGWVGRHLAKGLMAGEALRSTDLKLRQWVQPGERVQVQATGDGYAVSGEGQAMGVGLEGQDVRIRFDNGRMVTGRTVGERKVEVLL